MVETQEDTKHLAYDFEVIPDENPLEFVNSSLPRLAGTTPVIKQLSPHFFRVNYLKEEKSDQSMISVFQIPMSKVYEVVLGPKGYTLVDKTITK